MTSRSPKKGSILLLDVEDFVAEMFLDGSEDWRHRIKFDTELDLGAAHACIVVEDEYISADVANDKLVEYFMHGGTVVILAVQGMLDVPSMLNDIFLTRWNFASYTRDDYVVTPQAHIFFSDFICSLKFPHCKANRLFVPDEEALLRPYCKFGWHPKRETPIAIHVGSSGGRVAYFGCCNAEEPFVAMFQELCCTCKPPKFDATHKHDEEGGRTSSSKTTSAVSQDDSNSDNEGEASAYPSKRDNRFLSDEKVWSWFRSLQDSDPAFPRDHPYNEDRKQHGYGTKLQDRRTGSKCRILGSSFQPSAGGSPFSGSYSPSRHGTAMYKVLFDDDSEFEYLRFDYAHGRNAQYKPVDLASAHRVKDQRKALRAQDKAMRALVSELGKTEAKVEALRDKAAGASQSMERHRLTPAYWTECTQLEDGTCFVPILDSTWYALRDCLWTNNPDWLGQGRDYAWKTDHTKLRLAHAWRIENPVQYNKYLAEKEKIRMDLQSAALSVHPEGILDFLRPACEKLPGSLDVSVNEQYLIHGTSPERVLPIVAEGLNERLSGRPGFGFGCYLAEDAAKADQYVLPDEKFSQHNELHKRVYKETSTWHPGWGTCYMFLCRASLGIVAHTLDGEQTLDGGPVWEVGAKDSKGKAKGARRHAAQRELAYVPGSSKVRYHSQVVELSDAAAARPHARQAVRYREFVVPHGDRIYPEYLLAFYRA